LCQLALGFNACFSISNGFFYNCGATPFSIFFDNGVSGFSGLPLSDVLINLSLELEAISAIIGLWFSLSPPQPTAR
jgi:hypothetical protein